MKLRELLTKINDAVRPPHVKAESGFDRVIDDGVDAHQSVPVNWQDVSIDRERREETGAAEGARLFQ